MQESNNDGSEKVTGVPTLKPDWANAPTVSDLKLDLMEAQSSHDGQVAKIQTWLNNLNITGSAKRTKVSGRSNVQPKLIRKQAEWRYAALSEPFLSNDTLFAVDPVTYEDKDASVQNALVLNNQFETQINKVQFIDDYVRTAVDEGTIIVRVGWDTEEAVVEEEVPIYDFFPASTQQELLQLKSFLEMEQSDPEQFARNTPSHIAQAIQLTKTEGQPIVPILKEMSTVERTMLVRNQPTLEICNFNNIYVDPSCMGNLDKAGFIIYSFETSKSELKKDGKYSGLDEVLVSSASVLGDPDHTTDLQDGFNFTDEPRTRLVAYEYWGFWDIHGKGETSPIVATWVGDTMIRLEENPYPDKKLPFVTVQYLPVRREIYGEPDGSLLKDNQDIVGAVTRGAIDIMGRAANGQSGMRKDALDAVNRRRYEQGKDYEFNPTVDPRMAIINHQYPEIPNSVGLMMNMQQSEADSMTGVRAFGATNSDAGSGTATADRGVLDAASKRETGILRRLTKGLTDIGRKMISMNSEFLSEEEVVRRTNEDFVEVKRDDLAGNFDLKLRISTAEEDQAKASELAFMLQTGAATADAAEVRMIRAEIARLRKMPDLAHRIENYRPQPDPVADALKQLEVQKIQMEIQKLQTEAMENQAKAQLTIAKIGGEQAKAGNVQADTDKKNLDFLEQESGVTHARDVQQDGEQARSNMALEVVKASLAQQTNPKQISTT